MADEIAERVTKLTKKVYTKALSNAALMKISTDLLKKTDYSKLLNPKKSSSFDKSGLRNSFNKKVRTASEERRD
jgi:hypothetical protein